MAPQAASMRGRARFAFLGRKGANPGKPNMREMRTKCLGTMAVTQALARPWQGLAATHIPRPKGRTLSRIRQPWREDAQTPPSTSKAIASARTMQTKRGFPWIPADGDAPTRTTRYSLIPFRRPAGVRPPTDAKRPSTIIRRNPRFLRLPRVNLVHGRKPSPKHRLFRGLDRFRKATTPPDLHPQKPKKAVRHPPNGLPKW